MLNFIKRYLSDLLYPSVVEFPATEVGDKKASEYHNPYKEDYEKLWSTMILVKDITPYMTKIINNRELYMSASRHCWEHYKSVPWQVIAILHLMEAGCNPNRQVLNGEYWDRRTKYVPKGLGPWNSFEDSCHANFRLENKIPPEWELPNILYYFEAHNGFGYRKYRNINSPYLWSFTNHYVKGKYVADGSYNEDAISEQPGVAAILKYLGDL